MKTIDIEVGGEYAISSSPRYIEWGKGYKATVLETEHTYKWAEFGSYYDGPKKGVLVRPVDIATGGLARACLVRPADVRSTWAEYLAARTEHLAVLTANAEDRVKAQARYEVQRAEWATERPAVLEALKAAGVEGYIDTHSYGTLGVTLTRSQVLALVETLTSVTVPA